MRLFPCLMLVIASTFADNRRNKLPFVADAVGNTLPPPSNVPATVGSPVNLLTPDRYEFYTFDESGELVKRLMTLEEIQAIVAAGEETESLVTITNDNQPTVAFNVYQPPYNKVHSVVTNVQNVLKAQMEAHKSRPQIQPTLDTPDVSDSWSLILPSIFGNTGVDIVLDKSSGAVTTPDTEMIEEIMEDEDPLSKEGNNQVLASSTITADENMVVTDKTLITDEKSVSTSKVTTTTTSTTSTTIKPKTTTPSKLLSTPSKQTTTVSEPTTLKLVTTPPKETTTTVESRSTTSTPVTTTLKLPTTTLKSTSTDFTTTTSKPTSSTNVAIPTSRRPAIATTKRPLPVTRITTTSVLQTKTSTKPNTTLTTFYPVTNKPVIRTTVPRITTAKLEATTEKYIVSDSTPTDTNKVNVPDNLNTALSTEKNEIEFERISTFIPVSTINYISEHITRKPVFFTKSPTISATSKHYYSTTKVAPTTPKVQLFSSTLKPILSTSTFASSTIRIQNDEKVNVTTITTQSVSPSTTVSSTEFLSADKVNLPNNIYDKSNSSHSEPLPLFDVAQSISQIASDLGGNYQPISPTSDLLDTSNASQLNLESKENLDIDIPYNVGNDTILKISDTADKNNNNFIKISTIDPSNKNKVIQEENSTNKNRTEIEDIVDKDHSDKNIIIDSVQKNKWSTTSKYSESTTIDPVLSESMGDLLSQVVNQAPSVVSTDQQQESIETTAKVNESSSTEQTKNDIETTSEISFKVKKDTSSTTENVIEVLSEKQITKVNDIVSQNDLNIQTKLSEVQTIETNSEHKKNELPVNKNNFSTSPYNNVTESVTKTDLNATVIEKNINEAKQVPAPPIIEFKNETHKPEESITYDDRKTLDSSAKNEYSIETTTTFFELDLPSETITTNKINAPEVNTIYINDKTKNTNKNGKLPEPLPKVEDFRKKIQKVNIAEEELISQRNNSWKLIPTLSPPKVNEIPKEKVKSADQTSHENNDNKDIVLEFSNENQGLEVTTKDLGEDIAKFSDLSNELAFRYWSVIIDDIDKRRSFVFSPYSAFSMLAMIFMGARGATSGEMNEILKLDDMVTFNPHFTLKNISDSIETTPQSGVAISAFTRELYSDRNKGKILTFYKERAQHFYNGHVEEINFKLISDIIRRRTNLLVKRYTWGKMPEYMKTNNIVLQPPLAAFTANIFETDCSGTSVEGRDGEMYFVVSPNVRQRRLVPVPAVVYKRGFLAGYDPILDVTVAAIGNTNTIISTLFLMPGQQGNVVHADDLEKLEQRLLETIPTTPTWNRVLRTLLPRNGLELQIPRFSHKSTFNASVALKKMGLRDLFDGDHADLGGLNGPSKDLYLSDMIQLNTFVTCGEGVVGEQHHIEEYPETITVAQRRRARWLNDWDEPRDYQRAFHDPHDFSDAMHLPLHLRPRQARLPARSNQPARLKFDRPFLYFVRHNPSGMILYFGRYNPRLLP